MPDRTISPDPISIEELNFSSKKTNPNVTPNSRRVYLNGVTADTSPVRIALIRQK